MKILKNIDVKLKEMGFTKVLENKYGASYERTNKQYNYIHCVDLLHKESGLHIIQSYDKKLIDAKGIGNTCIGLTYRETKLFMEKMKKMGLCNKLPLKR